MSEEKKSSLGWILLVIVLVGVVGYLLMTRNNQTDVDPGDGGTAPEPPVAISVPPEDLVQLQSDAWDLQAKREFCNAEQKWRLVLAHGSIDRFPAIYQTAEMNLKTCTEGCKPAEPPVAPGEVVELPAKEIEADSRERPTKLTADAMQSFYPVGRKIGSTAVTQIKGKGKNKKFFLINIDCFFDFQYELSLETRVTENNPKLKKIVFQQEVLKVTELLASSESRFAGLSLPESPLAKFVWDKGRMFLMDPMYGGMVLALVEVIRANPETSKKIATEIFRSLPQNWQDMLNPEDPDMKLLLEIGKLQGSVLELTYYADMGVKSVRVLKGESLSRSLLEHYARRTHLVADHYMSQVEALKEGETMSLDVEAISNMIQIDPNVEVSGELEVRKATSTGGKHVLEIVGGTVYGTAEDDGATHRGRMQPRGGQIVYRPDEKMVTEATIEWNAKKDFVQYPGTWLFETSGTKNLEAKSRYVAERAPDSK